MPSHRLQHKKDCCFVYRGGISTYRELCSIANDLNQPDLIYKFMHLANHNAMWNSRKVTKNYELTIYMKKMFVKISTKLGTNSSQVCLCKLSHLFQQ